MRTLGWTPVDRPGSHAFKIRHGIAWVMYLLLLVWNLELLWEARRVGALLWLPALLLAWVVVFTALANIEPWLDGANRFPAFRVALLVSSLLSCVLGAWMLGHYGRFFLAAPVIVLKRPMELFSLSAMAGRFASLCLSLVAFAVFTWISLRLIIILVSRTRPMCFAAVFGEAFQAGKPFIPPDWAMADRPAMDLRASAKPTTAVLREPVGPTGPCRHLVRPRSLEPRRNGTYGTIEPPVLEGLAFRMGSDARKTEKCRELGWAAFEWILRTEPSLSELVATLEALPCLAGAVDEADASEAREWISLMTIHSGEFERALHSMEIVDHVTSVTIRVSDAARQALADWDQERDRLGLPIPSGSLDG